MLKRASTDVFQQPQNPKYRANHISSKKKKKMGVEKEVLRAGNGPKPAVGQKVTVHCTGYG